MTVTITWKVLIFGFVAICGGFTTVFVAASNFIKVVKAVKKPAETTKAKFDRYDKMFDNDRKEIMNFLLMWFDTHRSMPY